METTITVLIADDHPVFRRGLREIIETDEQIKVVADVGDGLAALRELRHHRPTVAVLDVDMPGCDGLEVVRAARESDLDCAFVLLTMYKEERFLNAAFDAGVLGYVVKDSATDEITAAIRFAAKGEAYVSPTLTDLLLRKLKKAESPAASPLDKLTRSERRVLALVAASKSSKQIADELFISIRTVDNHRANICAKLGLEGKNALLTYALTNKSDL